MTHGERAKTLGQAIELIEKVRDDLDTASSDCGGCGHTRYANWDEKQSHEALAGAITRLVRVRGREAVAMREAKEAPPS